MSTYSPSLIANAFLVKAQETGAPMTHMKLQKLVFFVHAWSLALKDKSLVNETPQAWQYGPVFNSLYHELKQHGSSAVSGYLKQLDAETGTLKPMIPIRTDSEFWNVLDQVWDRYGRLSALQLSALTHEAGGPWESARKRVAETLNDDEVRNYYRAQLHAA